MSDELWINIPKTVAFLDRMEDSKTFVVVAMRAYGSVARKRTELVRIIRVKSVFGEDLKSARL